MHRAVFAIPAIIVVVVATIFVVAIDKDIGLPVEDKGELGSEAVGDVSPGAGSGVGTDDDAAAGPDAVPDCHDGGGRAGGWCVG